MIAPGRRRRGPFASSLTLGTALCCSAASAFDVTLPDGAELVSTALPERGDHLIAEGPVHDGAVPLVPATGIVDAQVWHIPGAGAESAAMLAEEIAGQLTAQGYDIAYACADRVCGGFDFRRALRVGEAPEMHVDLGDFRYIAARRTDELGQHDVAVMISRGGQTAYLHIARITPPAAAPTPVTGSSRAPEVQDTAPVEDLSLPDQLLTQGRVALDDLDFGTGASALAAEDYASLDALAGFLTDHPEHRVVLVGHTDSEGSLEGNIALSEARAAAVRQYLIDRLNVVPTQVSAAGIGFLAPRAPNHTDAGREANRRVEVVLVTAY